MPGKRKNQKKNKGSAKASKTATNKQDAQLTDYSASDADTSNYASAAENNANDDPKISSFSPPSKKDN